ncbi:MAG: class I SAM-dependent rRNA methyltransferase, partial [Bryobacteraceae bacterium]
ADLLPGLIIDLYGDCGVLQTLTQGMDAAKQDIADSLSEVVPLRAIIERNDAAVRERESLPRIKGVVRGELGGTTEVQFNGLHWTADLLNGQKTGVYLDQRENYLAAARYAKGKALDCFTSTGGFALHLARICEAVEAVDSSEHAIAAARVNAAANQLHNITFKEADVFDLLAAYTGGRRKFDTIVLDPPAFAKSRSQLEGATRGYKEINHRALRLLDSGGILVTCSCSHHFSEAMLLQTVAEAALDAGKTLRVLERRTQALDHPILLTVPETHYLKCLIFEVV